MVVHNSFKNLAYLEIYLITSSKGMLSSTFLKTSKISFSLSSFFDLEELTGTGGIHWMRSYLLSVGRCFSLWRRRVFLFCTQFSFYLFFFLYLNLFWPLPFKFFPTLRHDRTNIRFWIQCLEGNFPFICASNFLTLEAICPICFSKLWILDLVSCWKDMTFCCKVTILEAKVFVATHF